MGEEKTIMKEKRVKDRHKQTLMETTDLKAWQEQHVKVEPMDSQFARMVS